GDVPVVPINARTGDGVAALRATMENGVTSSKASFLENSTLPTLNADRLAGPEQQVEDTKARFKRIRQILQFALKKEQPLRSERERTRKIDRVLTHPISGYLIFLGILFLIFQAIFKMAEWPMDLIDGLFASISGWLAATLPSGVLTDLLTEGIVPGIGGVVIFIPQIVLLFAFLAILEETGYMSRVVFLMDKLMRPFGLHGKSVVPLISGIACAIPAIMATRSIDQWKDRLVTIMVVPLMSCSARLPVYAVLIALVVPDDSIAGVFSLQGIALMSMYLLSTAAALLAAAVFKWVVKAERRSFLIMELPTYRSPRWQNIGLTLVEKTRVFVWEAGRIILAISIILWVLGSYGPPGRIDEAVAVATEQGASEEDIAAVALENSWIGLLGKGIEPAIRALGFDWQIGIALITSFAAREVFVGSMAIIYSVGEDFEEGDTLIERMRNQRKPDGSLVYSMATGFSLMVFYAFAMQCMSTLAVTRRETKSWRWPLVQLMYMTLMAYVGSLITYNILQ
ncbi:MAG: ferrous iron transport protein B, partial [Bacteroidota bacterium]